ncbi:hypothetical protein DFH06DRAFT_1473358 [Mycena polygramma]|nr:hypothetical protein DFH06DRAFT_1473358 [Mycena polygramma]
MTPQTCADCHNPFESTNDEGMGVSRHVNVPRCPACRTRLRYQQAPATQRCDSIAATTGPTGDSASPVGHPLVTSIVGGPPITNANTNAVPGSLPVAAVLGGPPVTNANATAGPGGPPTALGGPIVSANATTVLGGPLLVPACRPIWGQSTPANAQGNSKPFWDTIKKALAFLDKQGCWACLGRGLEDWAKHKPEDCHHDVANARDDFWEGWHKGAMTPQSSGCDTSGQCWACCRPQNNIAHGKGDFAKCPFPHIIKGALYSWTTRTGDWREHVTPKQAQRFGNNFYVFWNWALTTDPEHPEVGRTRLITLFHELCVKRGLIIE